VLKENLIAIRELIGKHRTTFDPKEVCRRAHAGGLQFTETPVGALLICLDSLTT